MTRVAALLIALVAIAMANPTVEYFLSEIRVAPDSLEYVEVHMYSNSLPYPVDLSGWQVTTAAGTATIGSGVVLQDSTDFAVIGHENTSGTFSLGDDSGFVALWDPEGTTQSDYEYARYGWTPPAGTSVSIYTHWEGVWPDEYLVGDWYLDSTPTFGAPNDDRYGGIAGRVLDRFGRAVYCSWVLFQSPHGNGYTYCDSTGHYAMSPLGPGTYQVSAHSDSSYLPAYYPDSVTIAVNGWRDSINITMYPVALAEDQKLKPAHTGLRSIGRTILLDSDRPASAELVIRDNLGRACLRAEVNLHFGTSAVPLPGLRSGVYFASCRFGERTLKTKFVLY